MSHPCRKGTRAGDVGCGCLSQGTGLRAVGLKAGAVGWLRSHGCTHTPGPPSSKGAWPIAHLAPLLYKQGLKDSGRHQAHSCSPCRRPALPAVSAVSPTSRTLAPRCPQFHKDTPRSTSSSPGVHNRAWLLAGVRVFPDCPQPGDGAGAPLPPLLFPGLSRTLPRRELRGCPRGHPPALRGPLVAPAALGSRPRPSGPRRDSQM